MTMIQVALYYVLDEISFYLDLLVIALTTVLAISWIYYEYLRTWVSRTISKLSMTVPQVIISMAPEFNFKTRKQFMKINNRNINHRCRKYISAKIKGKIARIGTKSPRQSKFSMYKAY